MWIHYCDNFGAKPLEINRSFTSTRTYDRVTYFLIQDTLGPAILSEVQQFFRFNNWCSSLGSTIGVVLYLCPYLGGSGSFIRARFHCNNKTIPCFTSMHGRVQLLWTFPGKCLGNYILHLQEISLFFHVSGVGCHWSGPLFICMMTLEWRLPCMIAGSHILYGFWSLGVACHYYAFRV